MVRKVMCSRNTVTQYLIEVSVMLSEVAPAERSRKPALSEAERDPV